MIAKINSSGIIKLSSAVVKGGGWNNYAVKDMTTDYTMYRVDVNNVNTEQEPNYTSWGLGSGYQVGDTGTKIFDEADFGASLEQLTVVNRGPNNLYVMVNATGFVRDGHAIGLETDESVKIMGPVGNIWAASVTGLAVIDAFGMPYMNPKTM